MSEHWYRRDGTSAYTIDGRPTTLRDARKHNLLPSVTTVLGVVHKAALVNWKEEQVAKAAHKLDMVYYDEAEYVAAVLAKARQFPVDAANEGTRIHDACETFVRDGHCRDEYLPHAQAAYAELRKLFPHVDDWVVEQSFGHPLGFGGKCDLHSPSTGIIADYKSKDGDFSNGKRLGFDQNWQLAAYQVGLNLIMTTFDGKSLRQGHAPGAAIFISRTHPGKVASHVWSADEMAHGWSVFAAALQLHKLLKGYDASW
jgi:hypothetical protein